MYIHEKKKGNRKSIVKCEFIPLPRNMEFDIHSMKF